jgi:nucleoid DNA-binding protein
VTRHEIALLVWTRLAKHQGRKLTKKMTVEIVKTVFELMSEALLRGELIRIERFGSFHPRAYPSKRSWSHTQKKLIDSRPFMAVRFSMGRGLKEAAKQLLMKKGGPDG